MLDLSQIENVSHLEVREMSEDRRAERSIEEFLVGAMAILTDDWSATREFIAHLRATAMERNGDIKDLMARELAGLIIEAVNTRAER